MRTLQPVNRHLLIVPHTKKNETPTGVFLPDDYSPEKDQFIEATVLAASDDCGQPWSLLGPEDYADAPKAIVDQSMIQEINLNDGNYHLILENYVVGVFPIEKNNEN